MKQIVSELDSDLERQLMRAADRKDWVEVDRLLDRLRYLAREVGADHAAEDHASVR